MIRTVIFNPKEFEQHLRRLAAGEVQKAMERGCVSGAMRCIPIVQRSVETAPPANPAGKGTGGAFNYGDFKRAWKAGAIPGGAKVFNTRPYAAVIEEGRRPGSKMPPSGIIEHWARRRLGVGKKEAKSLDFVIRRAISERGLLPRKVLERALPEMEKAVLEEIVRALEAAI